MYQLVFYVGLIGFVFFLLLSIYYFRRNNVVKLIGDMTGHNARHSIAEIRKRHAAKLADFDMTSGENMLVVRGETVNTDHPLERTTDPLAGGRTTDELPVGDESTDKLQADEGITDELAADEPETDILRTDEEETALLKDEEETMLLSTPTMPSDGDATGNLVASVLGQEMQELPDIFEVEEEATVVYIEE